MKTNGEKKALKKSSKNKQIPKKSKSQKACKDI